MILKNKPRNKKLVSVSECICFDRNGKLILLKKRSDHNNYPNRWGFPAGRLEKNEIPLDGMQREFFEETGFRINKNDFILLSIEPLYHRHSGLIDCNYVEIYTYSIHQKININKIKIDKNEHSKLGSFDKNELLKLHQKRMLMPDTYQIFNLFFKKEN